MNNYTIYTPISSIIRGFACFERFLQISTLQAPSMLLEDVFEANGSTKFAREAQKCPIWSKRAKYCGWKQCNTKPKKKKTRKKTEKVAKQPPLRVNRGVQHGPWWSARRCWLAHSRFAFFLCYVSIFRQFCAFCNNKSSLILSHGHPIPLLLAFSIIFRVRLD